MRSYRFHFVGHDGRSGYIEEKMFEDDVDAEAWLLSVEAPVPIELWHGQRIVAMKQPASAVAEPARAE